MFNEKIILALGLFSLVFSGLAYYLTLPEAQAESKINVPQVAENLQMAGASSENLEGDDPLPLASFMYCDGGTSVDVLSSSVTSSNCEVYILTADIPDSPKITSVEVDVESVSGAGTMTAWLDNGDWKETRWKGMGSISESTTGQTLVYDVDVDTTTYCNNEACDRVAISLGGGSTGCPKVTISQIRVIYEGITVDALPGKYMKAAAVDFQGTEASTSSCAVDRIGATSVGTYITGSWIDGVASDLTEATGFKFTGCPCIGFLAYKSGTEFVESDYT